MKQDNKPFRTRRSATEIRSLLHEQANSKMSAHDFCRSHQISRALFYHWRKKYNNLRMQPAFVPVHLSVDEPAQAIFAEIVFPQQLSIRLFRHVDPAYLKALIKP